MKFQKNLMIRKLAPVLALCFAFFLATSVEARPFFGKKQTPLGQGSFFVPAVSSPNNLNAPTAVQEKSWLSGVKDKLKFKRDSGSMRSGGQGISGLFSKPTNPQSAPNSLSSRVKEFFAPKD